MPIAEAETKTVGGMSATAIAVGDEVGDENAALSQPLALGGAPAHRGDPFARQIEDDVDPVERATWEQREVEASRGEVEVGIAHLRIRPHDAMDRVAVGLELRDECSGDQPVRSAHEDVHGLGACASRAEQARKSPFRHPRS